MKLYHPELPTSINEPSHTPSFSYIICLWSKKNLAEPPRARHPKNLPRPPKSPAKPLCSRGLLFSSLPFPPSRCSVLRLFPICSSLRSPPPTTRPTRNIISLVQNTKTSLRNSSSAKAVSNKRPSNTPSPKTQKLTRLSPLPSTKKTPNFASYSGRDRASSPSRSPT